jgi:uncharacterized RDD family membrane protein YckC
MTQEVLPPEPTDTSPYAGFWVRVAASCIDGSIIGLLLLPLQLSSVMTAIDVSSGVFPSPSFVERYPFLASVLVGWLYEAVLESSIWQATVGKKMCGLYVTDEDGARLSFGRATGRYFAKFLSVFTAYIGFVLVAFTARKQGLHDKIAGTYVMRRAGRGG